MSTVHKEFADNIVLNNGFYNGADDQSLGDNPRVVKIVEYTNAWGVQAFGLVSEEDHDPGRYEQPTQYVINPSVYWTYKP